MSRRRLAEVGVATLLVLGGLASVSVRTSDYRLPDGLRPVTLRAWEYVVVQHAARRIAASDRPADSAIPTADETDVVGFVDGFTRGMPTRVRRDLGRFLAYAEHLAPLLAGYGSRFTRLEPKAQDAVLASLEASSNGLLRAGFEGLKALVFMGYYRDARTWAILGYDGPFVDRPVGGFR